MKDYALALGGSTNTGVQVMSYQTSQLLDNLVLIRFQATLRGLPELTLTSTAPTVMRIQFHDARHSIMHNV